MKKTSRIPQKLADFILYINIVNKYLHEIPSGGTVARGITLGMTQDELDALAAFVLLLISGDPMHPGIWDLHSNKDTKTKKTRVDMVKVMKDFGIFFRPLLNRMAVSLNTTDGDRLKLNIAIPAGGGHHHQKVPIAEFCYVQIKPLINGDIHFKFKTDAESNRSNKAEGANAIEIASRIDAPADPSTKQKYKPLASVDDDTEKSFYSKSNITLQLGSGNTGSYFQFYCRWTNTNNPAIAGSWTGPLVVLIL
jgi:hypothetical protein